MASWLEEERRQEQERLKRSMGSSYRKDSSESAANRSDAGVHKQRAGIILIAVIFLFVALGLKFSLSSIEREKEIDIKYGDDYYEDDISYNEYYNSIVSESSDTKGLTTKGLEDASEIDIESIPSKIRDFYYYLMDSEEFEDNLRYYEDDIKEFSGTVNIDDIYYLNECRYLGFDDESFLYRYRTSDGKTFFMVESFEDLANDLNISVDTKFDIIAKGKRWDDKHKYLMISALRFSR